MTWSNAARLAVVLMVCSACGTPDQTPAQTPESSTQPPPAEAPANPPEAAPLPKPQFFGGTVTALDARRITVSRASPGKSPEHRTFLINSKTKMNKSVKVRTRVTVRYRHLPEGDIALEIQIRPLMRLPRIS